MALKAASFQHRVDEPCPNPDVGRASVVVIALLLDLLLVRPAELQARLGLLPRGEARHVRALAVRPWSW